MTIRNKIWNKGFDNRSKFKQKNKLWYVNAYIIKIINNLLKSLID